MTVQNRTFFTYLYLDNTTGMTHLKKIATSCMSLSSTGIRKIQNVGSYGFETQDLENIRVNSLLSLVADTRLGFSP